MGMGENGNVKSHFWLFLPCFNCRVTFLGVASTIVRRITVSTSLVVRCSSQQLCQRRALYRLDARHWSHGHQQVVLYLTTDFLLPKIYSFVHQIAVQEVICFDANSNVALELEP